MVTCVNDAMFPDTGKAVVRLLRRLGVDVEFPTAQTCCAQPMVNTGYLDEAVPVVRTFVDAFAGYDAIVTPSGSCAGSARHQHSIVARRSGDPALVAAVAETAPKTYELTEFLVDVLGVTDVGAYFPHRVTYHPTCHSLRMLGVGDRPRRLLEQVRGITLVDLPAAEECCGFGGTFAAQERRHLDRHGRRQGPARPRHRRRGAGRGRQLLPHAHRRHAVAAALRRTHDAPRRDPGDDGTEHLRRDAGVPRGGPRRAGRHPAPPQPRPRHAHDPRQACPGGRRGRGLGRPAHRRRSGQGRGAARPRHATSRPWSRSWSRPAPPCTGPATPRKPMRSSPRSPGATAPTRSSRSSRWRRRRSASTRRSRPRASRPGRPTWPS